MNQQRKYFTSNNTYTTNLITDLDYDDAGSGAVITEVGFYLIEADVCGEPALPIAQCVELTARDNFSGEVEVVKDLTYDSRNKNSGPIGAW
jgi:hypothetical protein|tara:strand:- start:1517 stop:1789 length:273 start_codon:yes stop_codon:yes gene_type:complete